MKQVLLIAALCLTAQTALAAEGDRPKARPALCVAADDQRLMVCPVVYRPARTVAKPATQIPAVRKMVRLPWMVGVYQ